MKFSVDVKTKAKMKFACKWNWRKKNVSDFMKCTPTETETEKKRIGSPKTTKPIELLRLLLLVADLYCYSYAIA